MFTHLALTLVEHTALLSPPPVLRSQANKPPEYMIARTPATITSHASHRTRRMMPLDPGGASGVMLPIGWARTSVVAVLGGGRLDGLRC